MSDGDTRLNIGAAQVSEVYLDREKTIEKDCEYIREAGELGLDLLVFPEFHVPASPRWFEYDDELDFEAYYMQLLEQSVTVPSPSVSALQNAAAEAECVVVIGVNLTEERGTSIYNAQLYIDADGALLGIRRKIMPTTQERLIHAGGSGESVQVFESSIGMLSGMMCGEHLNHLLAFSLMAEGQEIHAASWPLYAGYDRDSIERKIGIRTRFHAQAAKVPTALAMGTASEELAEAVGAPELAEYPSMSAIISPTGEYLAGPMWEGEGIVHAEVDMKDRLWEKSHHDLVGHYNRFDIFDLRVDKRPQSPITTVNESDATSRAEPGTITTDEPHR